MSEDITTNVNSVEKKPKHTKKQIIGSIIDWVLVVIAVGFAAFVFIFASKNPTSTSQASIFGKQTLLVTSGSMEAKDEYYENKDYQIKKIQTGSLIFLDAATADENKMDSNRQYTAEFKQFIETIQIGDVVTFVPETGGSYYITHRVVKKYTLEVNGVEKVRLETRGDVADSQGDQETEKFYAENVIGKVTGTNYALGWLYLNVFSNKAVIIVIIIAISGSIIIYEVVKVIKIVKEDKASSAKRDEKWH